MKKDRCPKCNRKAEIPATPEQFGFCEWCRLQFDHEDDDFGDYSNDPTRRLSREDNRNR